MKTIQCDKCRKKCIITNKQSANFIHIEYEFGYGTKYDGLLLEIDLCEVCLGRLFKEFIN